MEERPLIWKVFMQDDQNDPLSNCANDQSQSTSVAWQPLQDFHISSVLD